MCKALHKNATIKTYASKTLVVNEGDGDDCVYFILDGEVKITSVSVSGSEVWHNTHTAGWTFGEMAAISGNPRSANVTTTKKTKIASLSQHHFIDILSKNPEISMVFLKDMVRRLGVATHLTHELVVKRVSTRLARELLNRAPSSPNTNKEYPLTSKDSISEIARFLNVKRETISRIITIFESQGIVRRQNRKLIITNRKALVKRIEE